MPVFPSHSGLNLHYEEMGRGIPLVLVHGWAMSGRVWAFQEELADSCRLVTLDLRGHGSSGTPAEGPSLADLADDIVALFRHLDLSSACLLGWSLGAQAVLAAFPALRDRLAGMVLVGSTPRFTAGEGYGAGLPVSEPRGMGLRLRRDPPRTFGEFFRQMFVPGELSREQENRIARKVVMGGRTPEIHVALAGLQVLATADLRPGLEEIDCPVLLLHGDSDVICPPEAARYLAERLPEARLILLEGMGHAPFLSRPDIFNRRVAEFVGGLHGAH